MQRKNKARPSSSTTTTTTLGDVSGRRSGYDTDDDIGGGGGIGGVRVGVVGPDPIAADVEAASPPPTARAVVAPTANDGEGGNNDNDGNNGNNGNSNAIVLAATVRRDRCGTRPFDRRWLNLDPCGLVCACVTYSLHVYGMYAFCLVLLPPWMSITNDDGYRTYTPLCIFHSLSFREEQQRLVRGRRMCRRCQSFKPPRAHHCSICDRCIIKMDHHCPWINNCVGIGNHKYFLLFIFYTFLSCHYSFSFLVYRFFRCVGKSNHHLPRCVDHPTDLLPLVGLAVEALLFGLFTLCMMADQWDVVMTNLTHIDRLKGETSSSSAQRRQGGGARQQQHAGAYGRLPQYYDQHVGSQISMMRAGINEVFGTLPSSMTSTAFPMSRFHYTWLSPVHMVCFPESVRDDILGYCRPCGAASSAGDVIGQGARRRRGFGPAEIV
ncbi:hypothetical protein ACHAW5_003479 [Stephanodiscus triporus]|uniref:Palmitoyltransferase n=1 Tax=Stephanodiscus triporus TaxID=2934178 RepID=A0ABD3MKB8_9STRA